MKTIKSVILIISLALMGMSMQLNTGWGVAAHFPSIRWLLLNIERCPKLARTNYLGMLPRELRTIIIDMLQQHFKQLIAQEKRIRETANKCCKPEPIK